VHVMRNSVGDILFVTDGEGNLYESVIFKTTKNKLFSEIKTQSKFKNRAEDIWFCIPALKNPDRLKFAFEKSVELGITNFILFTSKRSVTKNLKPEKFQKTAFAAMKQSIRTFLPKIKSATFDEIIELKSTKILLDQKADKKFDGKIKINDPVYFLFGPEGGFDEEEINKVELFNSFALSSNRLRSETAIIKCASLLNL